MDDQRPVIKTAEDVKVTQKPECIRAVKQGIGVQGGGHTKEDTKDVHHSCLSSTADCAPYPASTPAQHPGSR